MTKPKRITDKWISQRYAPATWNTKLGDLLNLPCPIVVRADWATQRHEIARYLRKFGVKPGPIWWPANLDPISLFLALGGFKQTEYIHFQVPRKQYKWAVSLLTNAGYKLGELSGIGGATFP